MKNDVPLTAQPKRRWFQFGLRLLLILVTLVSIALGFLVNRFVAPAQRQRSVVAMVERLDGNIEYSISSLGESWAGTEFSEWLPTEYFWQVRSVALHGHDVGDREVAKLKSLGRLDTLYLVETAVSAEGFLSLMHFTPLLTLHIAGGNIDDDMLHHMAELRQLRTIWIGDSRATAAGVAKLRETLPHCTVVY